MEVEMKQNDTEAKGKIRDLVRIMTFEAEVFLVILVYCRLINLCFYDQKYQIIIINSAIGDLLVKGWQYFSVATIHCHFSSDMWRINKCVWRVP